jgi:hypothetical protein
MPTTRPPAQGGGVMNPPGLVVAGTAVILTGDWLKTTRRAVLIAEGARRHNGLPNSAAHIALAEALTIAMSARGHADVRECAELQDYPQEPPSVTIANAAEQLGLSERQTRRLATQLGGKKIGRQWLLDQTAIDEHNEGQKWTKTA